MTSYKLVKGKLVPIENEVKALLPAGVAKLITKDTVVTVIKVFVHTFLGSLLVSLPALTTFGETKIAIVSAATAGAAAVFSLGHTMLLNSGILPNPTAKVN